MTGSRVFAATFLLATMVAAKRQDKTGPATTMAPVPTVPAGTAPPPATLGPMTPGPATTTVPKTKDHGRVLQEVKFEGGKADATSLYAPDFPARNAFRSNTDIWAGGKNKHGTGDNVPFPHLIWYDFGNQSIVPARVGIRGDYVDVPSGYAPSMWEFIGSNDEECGKYSRWTVLCSDLSGKKFQWKTEMKYCDVHQQITGSFRCLGISVLNQGYKGDPNEIISLIKMWKNASPQ